MIPGPAEAAVPGNLLEMIAGTSAAGLQQTLVEENMDFSIPKENKCQ